MRLPRAPLHYDAQDQDRLRNALEVAFAPLEKGQLAAIADTSGDTLAQLEAEVNKLKAALRSWGILAKG